MKPPSSPSFATIFFIFLMGAFSGERILLSDLVELKVTGSGGDGLLGTNIDPPAENAGSGGIGPEGLFVDSSTNILHVHILWGLENGYVDLSGDVTLLHLHGPTDDVAPFNYGQVNSNVILNLANSLHFDPSATSGGLNDSFFLSNQQMEWLLDGRTYINVHTELNPSGEIRGYIVSIPEPILGSGSIFAALIAIRRRHSGR